MKKKIHRIKIEKYKLSWTKKKPRGTKIEKEKYNHNAYLSF